MALAMVLADVTAFAGSVYTVFNVAKVLLPPIVTLTFAAAVGLCLLPKRVVPLVDPEYQRFIVEPFWCPSDETLRSPGYRFWMEKAYKVLSTLDSEDPLSRFVLYLVRPLLPFADEARPTPAPKPAHRKPPPTNRTPPPTNRPPPPTNGPPAPTNRPSPPTRVARSVGLLRALYPSRQDK